MSGEQAFKSFKKMAKGNPAQLVETVSTNLDELGSASDQGEVLNLLAAELEGTVSVDGGRFKECSGPLLAMVRKHKDLLVAIARDGGATGRDGAGYFLTEAMRCINFASHDGGAIELIVGLIKAAGLKIDGDPAGCIQHATFANLGYKGGTVTMKPF